MTEAILTQIEADALLEMEKLRVNDDAVDFPFLGQRVSIALQSRDRREEFLLDLRRGRIDLRKVTMQNRARKTVVLARLDINGSTHTNPDGEVVPTPHLHIYREGYGDKFATAISCENFTDPSDLWKTLQEFMLYCNISEPPDIKRDLFT